LLQNLEIMKIVEMPFSNGLIEFYYLNPVHLIATIMLALALFFIGKWLWAFIEVDKKYENVNDKL